MQVKVLIVTGWFILPCLLVTGCACGMPRLATNCASGWMHRDGRCNGGFVPEYIATNDAVATSEELAAHGRQLEAEQQFDSAARFYRLAVKLNPGNAAALNALGILSARRGNVSEARQVLSRAVSVDPTKPLYRNNLASVLVDEQRYDEALRQLVAASGPRIGRHNLLYLMSVHFEQAGERRSLIETLMSQHVDDAVYFGPADGDGGDGEDDSAPPDDEQLPSPVMENGATSPAQLSEGDTAAPTEVNASPPINEIPETEETAPQNTIPDPSIPSNPLRGEPSRNELPPEPAAKTGSTLKLISPR